MFQNDFKNFGDGGYRSPYLSHAKRALYHLSYVPHMFKVELKCQCVVYHHNRFRLGGILFSRSKSASYNLVFILYHNGHNATFYENEYWHCNI